MKWLSLKAFSNGLETELGQIDPLEVVVYRHSNILAMLAYLRSFCPPMTRVVVYLNVKLTMYAFSAGQKANGACNPFPSKRSLKGFRPSAGYSPNFGGSNFNDNKSPKLVIPGEEGPMKRQGGGSLILPGGSSDGPKSPEAPGVAINQNFRPPPGFMDATDDNAPVEQNLSVDEMLRNLQSQSGHWHQLAGYLPKLQREGIDGTIIEEMTGIDRRTQNMWVNSSMVYGSLKKSGEFSDLKYFDQPGAENLLHELRFLSISQRVSTARYISENQLNDKESETLAKAVKEQERRKGEREGFSDSPADCLAFKYYRDALENSKEEDVQDYIAKGLEVAETETAKEALRRLESDNNEESVPSAESAKLDVFRLMKEEVGYRPIPLVGTLQNLEAESVKNAPKVTSSGVFGKFSIPQEGVNSDWLPLPAWSSLSLASHPVAIQVPNCADIKALRRVTGIQTDKDALKLQGQGIIVMDIHPETIDDPTSYYVGNGANGGSFDVLELKEIPDHSSILGKVLFVCRPPSRDSIVFSAEI